MKKAIIIILFLALILGTICETVYAAKKSYDYDMDPANHVDIMEGFGAAIIMILGFGIVLYEFDLFFVVYYIFAGAKTKTKTILNILAHLFWVLTVGRLLLDVVYCPPLEPLRDFIRSICREEYLIFVGFFWIALLLRVAYLLVSLSTMYDED